MSKKRTSLMEMAKSLNADTPQSDLQEEKPKPIKEMDKDTLTAMHIRLPKEMHKRLQLQRIEEERPMNDIITEAIATYLRRTSGPAKRRG